jgi:hypothetical protein
VDSPPVKELTLRGEGKLRDIPPTSPDDPSALDAPPPRDSASRAGTSFDDRESQEDVELICAHFNDSLKTRGFTPKTVGKTWRRDVRLMIDKDKLTPKQIMDCIEFMTKHDWWWQVVLSPANLRKNFERLRAAAIQQQKQVTGPSGSYRAYQDPDHSAYFQEW